MPWDQRATCSLWGCFRARSDQVPLHAYLHCNVLCGESVKNSLYFETNKSISIEKVNVNEIPAECDKKTTVQMFFKI